MSQFTVDKQGKNLVHWMPPLSTEEVEIALGKAIEVVAGPSYPMEQVDEHARVLTMTPCYRACPLQMATRCWSHTGFAGR